TVAKRGEPKIPGCQSSRTTSTPGSGPTRGYTPIFRQRLRLARPAMRKRTLHGSVVSTDDFRRSSRLEDGALVGIVERLNDADRTALPRHRSIQYILIATT